MIVPLKMRTPAHASSSSTLRERVRAPLSPESVPTPSPFADRVTELTMVAALPPLPSSSTAQGGRLPGARSSSRARGLLAPGSPNASPVPGSGSGAVLSLSGGGGGAMRLSVDRSWLDAILTPAFTRRPAASRAAQLGLTAAVSLAAALVFLTATRLLLHSARAWVLAFALLNLAILVGRWALLAFRCLPPAPAAQQALSGAAAYGAAPQDDEVERYAQAAGLGLHGFVDQDDPDNSHALAAVEAHLEAVRATRAALEAAAAAEALAAEAAADAAEAAAAAAAAAGAVEQAGAQAAAALAGNANAGASRRSSGRARAEGNNLAGAFALAAAE